MRIVERRFEFIDLTRAIFAIQGVLFHSLLPYRADRSWAVGSPESLGGVTSLTTWMHSFRMQGFFLISGILCWQLLERHGANDYVRSRATRLALPFATVLLTLNVAERTLFREYAPGLDAGTGALQVGHLWFISYLLLFAVSLPLLVTICGRVRARMRTITAAWSARRCERMLPVLLAAVAVVTVVIARLSTAWWYTPHFGFLEPVGLVLSGSYFYLGSFLACSGRVAVLTRPPTIGCWLGATVGWLAIDVIASATPVGHHAMRLLLEHIYGIYVLRIVFWAASRAVSRLPRQQLSAAVDSTMTVYLFHHFVVVAGAIVLLALPWHPLLEIGLLLFLGLGIPFVVHQRVICHFPLASLFFNGATRRPSAGRRPSVVLRGTMSA